MSDNSDKNPAAVALGKRRQAQMTAEERAAFVKAGGRAAGELNRKRTPEERRRIARQAAMTRRRRPKWLALVVPIDSHPQGDSNRPPADTPDDVEALARELADLPDDAIAQMVEALKQQFD